jgi:hypothetical protein
VFVVRYLALAALAAWVGGMMVLSLLAGPSAVHWLQAPPVSDPVTGGASIGALVRLFHSLAYACGGIILVCLLAIKFLGPPPRAFKLRAALVALTLAIAFYGGFGPAREMMQIESQVSGPVEALPVTDARRQRFDGLHVTSAVLMVVNVTLGLALLLWYVRE